MIPTVSYKYFMLSVIGCVHNATICMQRIATENKGEKKKDSLNHAGCVAARGSIMVSDVQGIQHTLILFRV